MVLALRFNGFVSPGMMNVGKLMRFYLSRKSFSSKLKEPCEEMIKILSGKFPQAKKIEVIDVSGGCGAMYEVLVESQEFKGMPIVKQHRIINEVLKEQIKEMHGVRIHTVVPKGET